MEHMEKHILLKINLIKKVIKISKVNQDNFFSSSFLNEINNLQLFSDTNIENIIKHYDIYKREHKTMIMLEYMDDNIEKLCINNLILNDMIKQISKALTIMHKFNIIHNDIHPTNILFKKNKDNKIIFKCIDFGLSGFKHRLIEENIIGGRNCIKPPELLVKINKNLIGPSIDIWAFGITCLLLIKKKLNIGDEEDQVLEFIYSNSIDKEGISYNEKITYENFVKSIENNDIEGSLNIHKLVGNYEDQYDVLKQIKLMCQLNSKDRILECDLIDNNIHLYSKYPSSYDNDNNIWYMINQFDTKPYISILVYEICLRYKNICKRNIKWSEILSIIYIIEVYLSKYEEEDLPDLHFISGLKKENFLELALHILNKIDFRIYNPYLNKCFSIIDNYNIIIRLQLYLFNNINVEDWLTNINEELLYKNRLKYLIENEEIYKLKFSNETEFTPEIRTNCILFMSSICIKKKCDKILHISIYLLDLFINKNLICKKKFKLVAITSIFFAGLLYRYIKIENDFLLAQTDYTIEEFTEFKYYYSNHIINNLKNIIISYDYTRLVDQTPFWIKTKETDYILIRFLLEIYLTYSENISVKPSLLIESILFYILRYFEGKKSIFKFRFFIRY